jgi:hypothetical protein
VGWEPFRGLPPPQLGGDEVGFGNGSYGESTVQMYAYAWGKKGADWTRAGRWQVRFEDRFDPGASVRSSAVTASLWGDEVSASEAMGNRAYGASAWSALLDPSGHAALADVCRSSMCAFYAIADGQPVLPIRDASGRAGTFHGPYANGAARVGETWFFLTQGNAYDAVALWRVDLGVARMIGHYYRPARYGLEAPRLVRRAIGGALGVLVAAPPEPGERAGTWYVLPVNPDTGELGEATLLARRDLAGPALTRCAPGQDGWLLDTSVETTTSIDVPGLPSVFDMIELRLRLDPGSACVEGLAARVDSLGDRASGKPARPVARPAKPAPALDASEVISLAARERGTGRRWSLSCQRRASLMPSR